MFVTDVAHLPSEGLRMYEQFRREALDATAPAALRAVITRWAAQVQYALPQGGDATLRDVLVAVEYAVVQEVYRRGGVTPSERFVQNSHAASAIARGADREVELAKMSTVSRGLYWAERDSTVWSQPWIARVAVRKHAR